MRIWNNYNLKYFHLQCSFSCITSLSGMSMWRRQRQKLHEISKYLFQILAMPLYTLVTSSLLGKLKVAEGHKLFISVVPKLREQSQINYWLARAIWALNPQLIISNSNLAGKRNDLLSIIYESNLIKADIFDFASMQFEKFCKLACSSHRNEFKEFDIYKHRLATIFSVITIEKIRIR